MAVDAWLPSNQKEERLNRRRRLFPIWIWIHEFETTNLV